MIDENDMKHLGRCVELATKALETGNPPFGSVLVDEKEAVRYEGHNLTAAGDNSNPAINDVVPGRPVEGPFPILAEASRRCLGQLVKKRVSDQRW